MKKEFLLAIIVGLVMGLFITYGIYYSQKSEEQTQITTTIEELEKNESSTESEVNGLVTIYNPIDESIIEDNSTTVTGKTIAEAFVIIFVNDDPIITQADETGNFSKEVNLNDLANIIRVHAIDEDGQDYVVERTVVVYDQELTEEEV
jgi:predicted histidine transporter YuiF (NhaC family)